MKKFNLKLAIGFGVGVTVFFLIKDLWMLDDYTFKSIFISFLTAFITGFIVGLLFGFISGRMKTSK